MRRRAAIKHDPNIDAKHPYLTTNLNINFRQNKNNVPEGSQSLKVPITTIQTRAVVLSFCLIPAPRLIRIAR